MHDISVLMPMSDSCQSTSSLVKITKDYPARNFRRQILSQVYFSANDQSLYGSGCQRTEVINDAPVPNLCGQGYRRLHSSELRKRLYLAYHGSGKTLTSFKASTLLKDNPDIEKCLFVVDRKDLDRQTREEFNRFQEGCVREHEYWNAGAPTFIWRLCR